MSRYDAPLTDMRFVLFDLLRSEQAFAHLGYTDATRDVIDAVLDEGARFATQVLAPLNRVGDEVGCTRTSMTSADSGPMSSAGEATTSPAACCAALSVSRTLSKRIGMEL